MLLEPVSYHKNLNFAIEFSNVAQEAPHYHKETEMTLVLRGSVTYRIHHQEFHLKTGDAIVVDTKDLHRIVESSEDIIMLTFYINMEAFTDFYPNIDFMIFACEEFIHNTSDRHQKMQNKISFLIHHMAEMMFLRSDENTPDQLMTDKLQEILYLMVNHFQGFFIENREFRSGNDNATPEELDRLYRIVTYMYCNYDKKITLQDVAEMEHLSMYYASHIIKKLSGLSFQNLLNYIRVECSEKLLNENKYTLTQISEFCGFSSLAYYNKCFRQWHGITPAQYKKKPRPNSRSFHKPFDQSEAMRLLEPYLNAEFPEHPDAGSRQSSTHVFIPVKQDYPAGRPFREAFPLNLVLDSPSEMENAVRLPFYADSITTGGEASLFPPLDSAAKALEFMLSERNARVRLCGSEPALLSRDGLPGPLYWIYKAFSQITGFICDQQSQYILVENGDFRSLILFNSGDADLHVHIQFSGGSHPDYMAKRVISYHDAPVSMPACVQFELAGGAAVLLDEIETEVTVHSGDVVVLMF